MNKILFIILWKNALTLSWWRSLSYRNQSIGLLCKSMDWFLYDRDIRHKKVNEHENAWCLWMSIYLQKITVITY